MRALALSFIFLVAVVASLIESPTARAATCTPTKAPSNPLIVISKYAVGAFPKIKSSTIPAEDTDNCLPSVILELPYIESDQKEITLRSILGYKRSPVPVKDSVCHRPECCGSMDGYIDCILTYQESSPIQKLLFAISLKFYIGRILEPATSFIRDADIASHKFPGDSVVIRWPDFDDRFPCYGAANCTPYPKPNGKLFTVVDAQLLNKLAYVAFVSTAKIRRIAGSRFSGFEGYECSAGTLKPIRTLSNLAESVDISYGFGADLPRPAAEANHYFHSLNIAADENRVQLGIKPTLSTPISGINSPLLEFGRWLAREDIRSFACLGAEWDELFREESRLRFVNNQSASTALASGLIIGMFFDEFANANFSFTANSSEALSAGYLLSQHSSGTGSGATVDCINECLVLGSENCLYLPLRGDDLGASLAGLYNVFTQIPPYSLSVDDLYALFNMNSSSPGYDLRGPTEVDQNGNLTNRGQASVVTTPANDPRVTLEFPSLLSGVVNRNGAELYVQFAPAQTGILAFVKPDDAILQARFGGPILGVFSQGQDAIFYMPNACVQVPMTSFSMEVMMKRWVALSASMRSKSLLSLIPGGAKTFSGSYEIGNGGGGCSCTSCLNSECCAFPGLYGCEGDCGLESFPADGNGMCYPENEVVCCASSALTQGK